MNGAVSYSDPVESPWTRSAQLSRQSAWQLVAFVGLHIPLALLMQEIEVIATAHALFALLLGLVWAVRRHVDRVMWVAAYIVGSEVLWRMSGAGVPWEYGKYALVLVLLVAVTRMKKLRPPSIVLIYFSLLVPAAWVTAFLHPFAEARQMISFNLSGPFTLLVCTWFCHRCVRFERGSFVRTVLVLAAPILGIATIAAAGIVNAEHIVFTGESNFATSGGFGPNQVSAMLGLGMISCAFALTFSGRRLVRLAVMPAFALMLVQSFLTFSRTGLALTIIGLAALLPFVLKTNRARFSALGLLVMLFVFVQTWMLPTLSEFTGGAIERRYTDVDLTNRENFMAMDLRIWGENPLFGIGAGRAVAERARLGDRAAAHTEFTRMLAEHGIPGLIALIALLVLGGLPLIKKQYSAERGVRSALAFWAYAFMVVSAFRVAAPALLLGICWASLYLEKEVYHPVGQV